LFGAGLAILKAGCDARTASYEASYWPGPGISSALLSFHSFGSLFFENEYVYAFDELALKS